MFLGIDIAKTTFDAALLPATASAHAKPRHKAFANIPAGFDQLALWLRQNLAAAGTVHACLEATGTYGEALALYLREAGYGVSVVNPAQIKAFGQSQLSRTKTDKADAALIARFCQMHEPPAWTPPPAETRALQALVRRLESLEQMRHMEHNRLEAGPATAAVKASLEATIAFLNEQIKDTKRQIKEHIDEHPSLKQQRDLLTSIPGIADTTAAALLSELLDVSLFTGARQVAAFAGLVPRIRQSGSSVRGRPSLSKVGSGRLRKALYLPAIVALRFNPLVKAMGTRLSANGKSKMLIVGAAMRKLLHLAFGVLKSGKPFDPNFATAAGA
jgi:transposase